jgi:hypothetical protein
MSYRTHYETNVGYLKGGKEGYRSIEPNDTYRGYAYAKEGAFNLYALVCPPGKVLPTTLAQRFTKIALIHSAVDKYLADNPDAQEGSLPDYVPPKPRRPHRRTRPLPIARSLGLFPDK